MTDFPCQAMASVVKSFWTVLRNQQFGNVFIAADTQGITRLAFLDKQKTAKVGKELQVHELAQSPHLQVCAVWLVCCVCVCCVFAVCLCGCFTHTKQNNNQSAHTQLSEYFAGTRTSFDLAYHPNGTKFQKQVWQALREIPFGQVLFVVWFGLHVLLCLCC